VVIAAAVAEPGFLYLHDVPTTGSTMVLWIGLLLATGCFVVAALVLPVRARTTSDDAYDVIFPEPPQAPPPPPPPS